MGVTEQEYYDKDGNHAYSAHAIRLGAYDRTVFGTKIAKNKSYVEMDFNGPMKYRRREFFDSGNRFSEILDQIKTAKEDPASPA